jgi:aromatic ring-cleaving dioxygenase
MYTSTTSRRTPNKPNSPKNYGKESATNVITLPHFLLAPPSNQNILTPLPVPELRIYKLWDQPIGPHPVAMFEVNLFTPAQFGAFIPWLVINRGPLSALLHPNTVDPVTGESEDEERDHTQRATWLGERMPLDLSLFKRIEELKRARREAAGGK